MEKQQGFLGQITKEMTRMIYLLIHSAVPRGAEMKGHNHMHENTHTHTHTHTHTASSLLPGQLLAVFHMCGEAPYRDSGERSRGSATYSRDHYSEKFISETHPTQSVHVCVCAPTCSVKEHLSQSMLNEWNTCFTVWSFMFLVMG